MNNFKKNQTIIQTLKTNSDQFNDLQVVDTNLVFKGISVNLNEVDLEVVIKGMEEVTPDNLFNALNKIATKEEKKDNITQWEEIKKENPDMKSITVFNNHNLYLNKQEEFINIRTNDGQNHLFKNVIGLDIFNEYVKLKAIYGDDISPDVLARNIEKWQFNELRIEPAALILENPNVNENIKNQLQEYVNKYKGNPDIEITANVEEDIIYINNIKEPEKNFIITFTKDMNNELVALEHSSNVQSETITKEEINPNPDSERAVQETKENNSITNSQNAAENTEYKNTETILSDNEFSYIVSKGNFSKEDIEKINKYLENSQEMVNNHDPNIETKFKTIEDAVTTLQLMKDTLNEDEQLVIDNCNALLETYNKSMGMDKGQVLTYNNNPNGSKNSETDETDNFGYLNIISIFITISVVLIGLSILVLYFING